MLRERFLCSIWLHLAVLVNAKNLYTVDFFLCDCKIASLNHWLRVCQQTES